MIEAVTEDRLLGGRVKLMQPAQGYRVAIDPILLAAAVPARAGDRVLDVGAGSGAAALCLATRVEGCRVMGIELQTPLVRLANDNAARNGLGERVTFSQGDVSSPPAGLKPGSFDHVMTNPPFLEAEGAMPSPHPGKVAATIEGVVPLGAWLEFCLAMAKPRGSLSMIHRADRLDAILASLHGRAGEIVIFPLWPQADGRPAKRILLGARKGLATPAKLAAGLVLHDKDGAYTPAAEAVLRQGEALRL